MSAPTIPSQHRRTLAAGLGATLFTAGWAPAARAAPLRFVTYTVTDPQFGGMRVGTLSIPEGWRATSQVKWDFGSANYPVNSRVRVESPDGKMWLELLPFDVVYWMQPVFQRIPLGQRAFGAVYAPNATIEQALEQLIVRPARGQMPGFAIVGKRPVDAQRMAQAFNQPEARGEAMAMRVKYMVNGRQADEDIFGFYTAVNTIPYNGPQGRSAEYHRMLVLAHAVGATDGLLPSVYPLLGSVVSSIRLDENFIRHRTAVSQHIVAQYNAALQRGYDSIAAAGQISRSISANNDALLASMQQQRVAQQRADAQRRSAGTATSTGDGFSQYIRGTTRMADPYWGTSDRDSNYGHHWTDGQGNYRASNDPGFNPNVGGGGGANWQRMEPAR
jgi:hypothetical protein